MSQLRRNVRVVAVALTALACAVPASAQFRSVRRPPPPIPPRPQPVVDRPAVAERPVVVERGEVPVGRPVDPELVRLRLVDGSIIVGKLAVERITVDTEFGPLDVPVTMLRGFKPGLHSHWDLRSRLEALLADLGGEDYRRREGAQRELLALGPQVRAALQRHAESENAELSRRVRVLLSELAREAESADSALARSPHAPWIDEDTVETLRFTAVGRISPRTFAVHTPYGTLNVDLADIETASRPAASGIPTTERSSFPLEATYLAQLKFKSSGLRVRRGDAIRVTAEGTIHGAGNRPFSSSPTGSDRFGIYRQHPPILGGTLVARIGSGPVIKIGSEAQFIAERSGVLQFAIAMRPDYVGRYPFEGQYHVKVTVTGEAR